MNEYELTFCDLEEYTQYYSKNVVGLGQHRFYSIRSGFLVSENYDGSIDHIHANQNYRFMPAFNANKESYEQGE